MATPMCPKCESTSGFTNNRRMAGTVGYVNFILCKSCDAVVGVIPDN